MDSHTLIQTLHSIGYPNAEKLKPQDLEWAFENPATLPFLQWFSNSIGADNVVSSDDIKDFKQLEDLGSLMEGCQLEEALENVKLERPESENLESEIEKSKKSLAQAKACKQALIAHRSKLSVQQMTLHNRVLKMKEVEDRMHRRLKLATEKCAIQDTKISTALQSLSAAVAKLSDLYKSNADRTRGSKTKGQFLSQLDLSAFQDAETKYSQDLTAFTKKQFFEGVAQMSGEGSAMDYSLIDLKSPQKGIVVDKDKEQAFLEDCEEMSRLQQIFPRSESDRINALVNAKKAHCAVAEATNLLESLKSGHFPSSVAEISHLCKSLDKSIESAVEDAQPFLASLPDLIRELGSLQGGEVLTGDYDLKLKRQDYFTKKQDEVISHLVSQRARSEFLSLLYDLELRCHKETHVLLSTVDEVLGRYLKAWQQRMEELEDPDLSEKKFQGSVVDARDTSTLNLFHMLGESEADKGLGLLCVQKQKVVEKAKHLHAQHTCAKAMDQTMDEKYMNKVKQLEDCVKECEGHLYTGSSTTSGQPMLSSSEIQESIVSLTANLAKLKKDMTEVIVGVDKKKAALKNNVLQSKERELFTMFHTNPGRLQYIKDGLADRSKAKPEVSEQQ